MRIAQHFAVAVVIGASTPLACSPSAERETTDATRVAQSQCPDGAANCLFLPIVLDRYEHATVSVFPGQVESGTISPGLFGVAPGTGGGSGEPPINTAGVMALGARSLRYPMGCKADAYDWHTARHRWTKDGQTVDVQGVSAEAFVDAARAANAQSIWVANVTPKPGMVNPCSQTNLNGGNGPLTPGIPSLVSNTLALLDDLAAKGKLMDAVELGNEPWGPRDPDPGDPANGLWHPSEYRDVAVALAEGIKAKYPSLPLGLVGAPSTGNNQDPDDVASRTAWTSMVTQIRDRECGSVACFDFVTDHPYHNDGYKRPFGVSADTQANALSAARGVEPYRGTALRFSSTGSLPAPLQPNVTYYVSLPAGQKRSDVFGVDTDRDRAIQGDRISLTSADSGQHEAALAAETNFLGRAVFLPTETYAGRHLPGPYPNVGILELERYEAGSKHVALTEWNIINWVKAYNNPIGTVEHAEFVLESLLLMAKADVWASTLWDCYPASLPADIVDWKPQCVAFELASRAASGAVVRVDVRSSERAIPQVQVNSLAMLAGGYTSPNLSAYAVKSGTPAEPRLLVYLINHEASGSIAVDVTLPSTWQGRFTKVDTTTLAGTGFTGTTLARSETSGATFGGSAYVRMGGASIVLLLLH